MADAAVTMIPKYGNGLDFQFFMLSGQTDVQGNFEFRNVVPGNYRVRILAGMPGFRSLSNLQNISVGDKNILDLQFTVKPFPGISGRVISEGGEMLPQNRTVLFFNNFVAGVQGTGFGTGLQQDGGFTLSNLPPGVFHLELTGFPDNFFIRSARSGDKDILKEGLDLSENTAESVTVTVASTGGAVDGVVNDERQAPVVGARVVLVPTPERRERIDLFKTATTDQFGRFTIRGVVPGDYKMFAWEDLEPNIYFDRGFMEQHESQGVPTHVAENGHLTSNLTAIPIH